MKLEGLRQSSNIEDRRGTDPEQFLLPRTNIVSRIADDVLAGWTQMGRNVAWRARSKYNDLFENDKPGILGRSVNDMFSDLENQLKQQELARAKDIQEAAILDSVSKLISAGK